MSRNTPNRIQIFTPTANTVFTGQPYQESAKEDTHLPTMLSSLPPLFPHDPHILWYPSLTTTHSPPTPNDPSSTPDHQNATTNNHLHPHHHQQNQNQNQQHPHQTPRRTLLRTLHADETALLNRKANIRRFGAGWLRPPGVPKTLQGMADERAEREEVEAARAREMAAMALVEEAQEGDGVEVVMEGVGMGEGERDLDADVPEGEGGWLSDEGVEAEGEGVTLLEDEGVEAGEVDVDLDDEVPDADDEGGGGSYEHTDTEVEDDSSGSDGEVPVGLVLAQGPRLGTFNTRTGEEVRRVGSPVFGSSTVGGNGPRGWAGRGRGEN